MDKIREKDFIRKRKYKRNYQKPIREGVESQGFKSQSFSFDSMTFDGHHVKKHSLSVQQFKCASSENLTFYNNKNSLIQNLKLQLTPKFTENSKDFDSFQEEGFDERKSVSRSNEQEVWFEKLKKDNLNVLSHLNGILGRAILIEIFADLGELFLVFLKESRGGFERKYSGIPFEVSVFV